MKTAALAFVLTFGALGALCQNEPCGNNAICGSECVDGLYHIVQSVGKSGFGCVVGIAKKRNIDVVRCYDVQNLDGRRQPDPYTKDACTMASGTFCDNDCFIPNKDQTKLQAFSEACRNAPETVLDGYTSAAVAADELPSGCKVPN